MLLAALQVKLQSPSCLELSWDTMGWEGWRSSAGLGQNGMRLIRPCFLPFLGLHGGCAVPNPRPSLLPLGVGDGSEGPRLGVGEGRIISHLEQHFLSNSGIKIPRSRACDRRCWSWYSPPGWQRSPAARPLPRTAGAQALVRDRIPLEVGIPPRAGGGLRTALPGEEQSVTKENILSLT